MNGHFVITYKATTETGKEFFYLEYVAIKYGQNIMREMRTTEEDNGRMKFKIEVQNLYQFGTKKEAVEFAAHNNKGANMNGTGLNAFLMEIDGES